MPVKRMNVFVYNGRPVAGDPEFWSLLLDTHTHALHGSGMTDELQETGRTMQNILTSSSF